ncbi:MAG: hypothetical protein LBS62_02985 [Clostridiales bacterium]|jgi:hypothetical protein|nr:hypothetical protein [Clostridiales bacterium]
MIYFVTERYETAGPIIVRYALKKITDAGEFDIYEGKRGILSTSGAGAANYAACAARLLTLHPPETGDVFAALKPSERGGVSMAVELVREGIHFYPDILYRHDFEEVIMYGGDAYYYEAAVRVGAGTLPPHRIFVISVGGGEKEGSMADDYGRLCGWLETIEQACDISVLFTKAEECALKNAEANLRLTAAMRADLRETARIYKARGGKELDRLLECRKCWEKREGKERFAEMRQRLLRLGHGPLART